MDIVVVGFASVRPRLATLAASLFYSGLGMFEAFPAKGKASIIMVIGGPVLAIGPPSILLLILLLILLGRGGFYNVFNPKELAYADGMYTFQNGICTF
jgi:hypothetical protein